MIKEIQLTSHSIFPKQSRVFMLCILFYFLPIFAVVFGLVVGIIDYMVHY